MRNRMSLTSCIVWAGLVALTVLGVLGLKPIPQGAGSEVMLLEDLGPGSTQDLGARLSSEGVTVLENYGSFALVSITQEQRGELEREHLRVSDLPDRTRTGRGSIFFDSRNGEPVLPANLQADLRGADLDRHYIVQLIGPIKQAWLQNLESVGVELFDYLPSYSFVVAMPPRTVEQVRKLPFVQWVGIYHPGYKLTRGLLEPKTGNRMVLVLLFPRQSSSRVESLLASWGAAVAEHWSDSAATGLRVSVPSERVLDLARLPEVSWIEEYAPQALSNVDATWVVQSNASGNRSIHAHGIQGECQTITFAEGAADTTHPALQNKVREQIIPTGCGGPVDWHATSVASVLAGNYPPLTDYTCHDTYVPNVTYDCYDGNAPAASLLNVFMGALGGCSISDWYNAVFLPSYQNGARVHAEGPDAKYFTCPGAYSLDARAADLFVWDHKDFLITMPAGNEDDQGGQQQPPGSVRCMAQAKNIVTVGATWNGTSAGKMASYSSRGPAYDGRIKPTVVAPGGDSITADGPSPVKAASTSSSDEQCGSDPANRYHPTGGTSFAHPAVAGSAALVRQYFTDGWYPSGVKTPSQWINPSAALIKAVLVNSAVQLTDNSAYEQLCVFCSDCPHPHYDCSYTYNYPNKIQGWGRILLENSLYFSGDSRGLMVVDDSSGLANSGDVKEYSIQVTDSTPVEPLKATLVWSDYPAAAGTSGPALQNNLDLVVKDPACTAYNGNHFSSGIASQSLPGGSNDARNVEEEVLLGSPSVPPTPGIWAVSVRAANIVQAYQPFALVATGKVGRYLLTAAGDEMTGLETIVSGSYVNTQASDDVYEVLQEVLQGDVSVLEHVWRFDNVSPCRSTLTLRLEGNRPSNPDGDNFKFYWSDSLNGTYTEIPNAVISLPAELQGGIDYPFAWPGTSSTIYIKVKDTHQEPGSGSSLDRLNIDFLQIR